MALFAISDFHLALSGDKPMDIFGQHWHMHHEKIKINWLNLINKDDTVLIAGDISWSMNIEDGLKDLEWIHNLPGRKIFVKGNHDYFWTSINKLNNLYEDMKFIQNNFFPYKQFAICGTRGWNNPDSDDFSSHDEKIYKRELIRLKLSLDDATRNGYKQIIVMMHFPPFTDFKLDNEMIKLIKEYKVEKVIYGHLHGVAKEKYPIEKSNSEVTYILTSCDCINFTPIKIMD